MNDWVLYDPITGIYTILKDGYYFVGCEPISIPPTEETSK